jgi:hypothetical protein
MKTFYYIARKKDPVFGVINEIYISKDPNEILAITPLGVMPINIQDLTFFHAEHTNLGKSMSFNSSDGTLTCLHCHKIFSISNEAYGKLLKIISVDDKFGSVKGKGINIRLVRLVKIMPLWDFDMSHVYLIRRTHEQSE